VTSVADIRNASHGDFFGIWLIFGMEFSIIHNKLNIEYRTQNTGDRILKAEIRESGDQIGRDFRFSIGDWRFMIFSFIQRNQRNLRF
jgi:hypothetical protein